MVVVEDMGVFEHVLNDFSDDSVFSSGSGNLNLIDDGLGSDIIDLNSVGLVLDSDIIDFNLIDDDLDSHIIDLNLNDFGDLNIDSLEDWGLNDLGHIFGNSLDVVLNALSDVRSLDFDCHGFGDSFGVVNINEFGVWFEERNTDGGIVSLHLVSDVRNFFVFLVGLNSWNLDIN